MLDSSAGHFIGASDVVRMADLGSAFPTVD